MLWILKGEMPFKMHEIIFFFQIKKIMKKINMCLPYLTFSDPLPVNTRNTLIFLFGLVCRSVL